MAPSKSKNKSNKSVAGKSPKQVQNKMTTAKTSSSSISSISTSSPLDILSSSPDSSSSSPDHHNNSGSPHGTALLYFESDPFTGSSCYFGEEDHPTKESLTKTPHPDNSYITVPGLDNDRREKIRLKNEKKHARQKERRAQELHDRCCGVLMLRKLELLSQQIVAMGFSKDRAATALMMNEGKVEESVNWLFEGNGDTNDNDDDDKGESEISVSEKLRNSGLKVDIGVELAEISAMEIRFKCSKQDVERAVVGSEGDLQKAMEVLLASQKPVQPPSPPPPPPVPLHGNVDLLQRKRMLQNSDIANRNSQNQKWGGHGHGYNSCYGSTLLPAARSSSKPYSLPNAARWYSSNNVPMVVNQRSHHQHHRGPASYKETPFLFSNPIDATSATRMEASSWMGGGGRSSSFSAAASNLPSLAAPSSLGLFASWGSSNSQVDWNTGGLMSNLDYTNIDWSLDSNLLPAASNKSRRRMWVGISSLLMSNNTSSSSSSSSGIRRNGTVEASSSSSSVQEWTSPFAQKDMFSLYRQFVTSPSL
ncbi:hypothetical protein LINPERPRIM_LOCUS2153 [Linum perenne]